MAHAGGRPQEHDYKKIAKDLNAYVNVTEIPAIAEFCYKQDIRRDYIYKMAENCEELSHALKRCIEKKEAQLEIKSLNGEINTTQAIFSLKQLGWRDKQEIESKVTSDNVNHNIDYDAKAAALLHNMTDDERQRFLAGDMTDREKEQIALRK